MLHRLMENGVDMVVRQGVDDGLSISPAADQAGLFQDAKLVGNGGLRHL